VLYSFVGGSNGENPYSGLTDVNGVLYGTTVGPGDGSVTYGTVFKITTSGADKVLYRFKALPDGEQPAARLTDVGGVLYGTTQKGGDANNDGTVFKITTSGTESVIYRFAGGSDGSDPGSALTNVNGILYGTTFHGGDAKGDGTVFEITTAGVESVLYRFPGGGEGANPSAGLTNVDGVLYGTTQFDRNGFGAGTVFKITTAGAESVIYRFGGANDGFIPRGDLTNVNGVLYGTTFGGFANNQTYGTVFRVTTSGAEKVLHGFGGGNDGGYPNGDLTNVNGVLYGTTIEGGGNGKSAGTVFKITTSGVKSSVYRFEGGSDGMEPEAGLTYVNGVLYGTTAYGGTNGHGTVFSLSL
jgi:uncharacterized repeat protein (TIGR03803 family)